MVCGVLKIKITEAKKLGPGAKKLGVRIGSE